MTVIAEPRVIGTLPGEPVTGVDEVQSLYVHIPFCERKCEYCDFTSVAGLQGERAYMEALRGEIALLGALFPGTRLHTVFVGGGTPSLVDPELLSATMRTIRSAFTLEPGAEVTLEANPSSTSVARAQQWLAAGFNRVSLGVQSLEADVLAFLGRVHDADRALQAVREVQAAGFVSVNCDLIYAVPGLDDARWLSTLSRVLDSGPSHVSCYELTVEAGTPLHRSVRLGQVTPVDAEAALRQHATAAGLLEPSGLVQYEVSNYAIPGHECRHNLVYWRNGHYLAAGVGAHGHVPARAAAAMGAAAAEKAVGLRYWHGRGIAAYVTAARAGRLPLAGYESIDASTSEVERVMLGLRLREGVELHGPAKGEAAGLASAGLIRLSGSRATTTHRGREVLNAVALRLASPAAA